MPPPRTTPKQTPQKSIFWLAQTRALIVLNISTSLRDKCFAIIWEYPPGGPPKWTYQKLIFSSAQNRVPVLFDINRCLTDKYFIIVWGCHFHSEPPQTGPPKNKFLHDQIYDACVFHQRWSPRGRPCPRGRSRGHILKVLGLGLETSSPWPWPRSLRSSKLALSSARGQHYFWTVEILSENARNLAENL